MPPWLQTFPQWAPRKVCPACPSSLPCPGQPLPPGQSSRSGPHPPSPLQSSCRSTFLQAVSLGPAQASGHILPKKELKRTPSPATKPSPRPHSASGPVMRLQESGNSLRGWGGVTGGRETVGRGQGSPLTHTCLSQLHTLRTSSDASPSLDPKPGVPNTHPRRSPTMTPD